MALRLHDTLTRRTHAFEPAEAGHVRMYTCGPTVYERAHIGNFRAFIWEDLLRRYLKWKGYRVTQVMNITDVDDRTIQAAIDRGVSLEEVSAPVTRSFFEDWETLGLEPVEQNPRATRHVPQMIELVKRLEEAGYTYEKAGSVYFAIDRFPGYGHLANIDPDSLRPGERVEGERPRRAYGTRERQALGRPQRRSGSPARGRDAALHDHRQEHRRRRCGR